MKSVGRWMVLAVVLVGLISGVSAREIELDGFEDGDFTSNPSWSNTAGSSTTSSATVFQGSFSVQVSDSGGGKESLSYDRAAANQDSIFDGQIYSFYNFVDSGDFSQYGLSQNSIDFSAGPSIQISKRPGEWQLRVRDSGGVSSKVLESSNLFDQWIKGEIEVYPSNNTVYARLFDDQGNKLGSATISGQNVAAAYDHNLLRTFSAKSFFDEVSYGNDFENLAPKFNSSSVSPDPPKIGENISYSAEVFDSDGSIQNTELTVTYGGSTVVNNFQRTGTTPSFDDVFVPQSGNKFLNATLTTTDDAGATTTTEINRFLGDSKPSVSLDSPSGTVFDYDQGFQVNTQVDGDSRPDESLSCVLSLDSTQIDQRTVTEGTTYTVSDRADLGTHNADVTCTEQDDQRTDSGSTSFTVEEFQLNSVSGVSQVFETETTSFTADLKAGDMVQSVESELFYDSSLADSKTRNISGITDFTESLSHTVGLVQNNQTSQSFKTRHTVEYTGFNGNTQTTTFNSSGQTQQVLFNYHSPSIKLSKTDVVEQESFQAETDLVNEVGDKDAQLSFPTSFNGSLASGKTSEYSFPLLQNTNKSSKTVSGNVSISFQGETQVRQSSPATVTGFRKVLTTCSTGLDTAKALEISVFDEKNRTVSLNSQIGWEFTISAFGHSRSYQFNKTASTTQNCIYPGFAEYQASGDVFYESPASVNSQSDSYPARIYSVTDDTLDNSKSNLNLYLLSENFATPVSYKVIDSARSPVQGVTVSVQKYFAESSSFVTVAQLQTAEDGTDTSFIETNDIYYKHVLSRDNTTLKSTDRQPFFCSSIPCRKTFQVGAEGIDSFFEQREGFDFLCSKTFTGENVSGFKCEVGHTGDLMENASLQIFRQDPIGETRICNASGTSNEMTLICPLNDTEGEIFQYVLEGSTSDQTYTLKTGTLDFTTGLTGSQALFPAFVVFLAFSMLGLVSPKVSIIFSTAGFLVAYGFGFIAVSTAAVGSIVAVALFMVVTSET